MLTPREALEKIFQTVTPLGAERASLDLAVDRILAEDIVAQIDLPPFPNSAMDGFAVRFSDIADATKQNPASLRLREKIKAGSLALCKLGAGEAAMIMTGAPIPEGADAVVMKEFTSYDGNGCVRIFRSVAKDENIRPQGEDVQIGGMILKAGTRIRPYEIALLAAQGYLSVPVLRKPKVAVLSTGDELVPVPACLVPGKIRNSNGPALAAAIKHWDLEAMDFGIARDEESELESMISKALNLTDVLVVTGGVSVGDFDFTKAVLNRMGVQEIFWKVAIKPGKPLYFGVTKERKFVFGLPGNPISALVCLEEFIRPALEKLQGFTPSHPSYHLAGKALNDYPLPLDRRQYLFCRASPVANGFELTIIRPQGSAMMGMATKANALAVSPEGVGKIKAGDEVPFRWLK